MTHAASCLLLLAHLLFGCSAEPAPPDGGDDAGTAPDAGTAVPCTSPSDCDDGLFCNGQESCSEGFCQAGETPDCDDGVACTRDVCSDARGACRNIVPDADGDGVGTAACVDAAGAPLGQDCDDANPARFPGAEELCDTADLDEDCDPSTFGPLDLDGDRYRSSACCNVEADGTRRCGEDCDDSRAQVSPASTEACDGFDNDCDGRVDEGVGGALFVDADRDGHGDPAAPMSGCSGRVGLSVLDDDCDDTSAARNPGQPEFCDVVDNDCDARVDEMAAPVPWYPDRDGDGFGARGATPSSSCAPLAAHSLLGTDCDDGSAARNPAAAERCNGRDDDCNDLADFVLGVNDTEDDDGDGLADVACAVPDAIDCDDRDARTGGGEDERCDGRDNDCDTRVDEGSDEAIWYLDADGDGYGSVTSGAVLSCAPVAGYVRRGGDCDDDDDARRPDQTERCNAIDDDCSGAVDDGDASSTCALPAASAVCTAGRCLLVDCDDGFADCDGRSSNGCETGLGTGTNCLACGDRCESPRQASSCMPGTGCVAGACTTGFGDCDGTTSNGCETDLRSSASDCGACGSACSAAHADTRCSSGTCTVVDCQAGWGNCDGDATNGCERALNVAAHCGGCGVTCSSGIGTMSVCDVPAGSAVGFCRVTGCAGGFGDCNSDGRDGCETNTRTSPTHCGACGQSCPDPGNPSLHLAESRCPAGVCALTCAANWANCDGNALNGCETDLTNATSCGACGNVCAGASNRGAVCAPVAPAGLYGCQAGACFPGWGDCDSNAMNGCERDLSFDPSSCGGCGVVCTALHGSGFCRMGTCGVGGCDSGWGDCNGIASDGCERSVNDDAANCGRCGNACRAGSVCSSGMCDPARDVVAGGNFTCVRRERGGVVCFGRNTRGQLGDGTTTSRATPSLAVLLPRPALAITAGAEHACALLDDGRVFCWGDNFLGQLGRGTSGMTAGAVPEQVPGLEDAWITTVAAGWNHTCVGTSVGEVRCWGDNSDGALGRGGALGGTFASAAPTAAAATGSMTALWAGQSFACVLQSATLSCWGRNDAGQLGTGTGGSTSTPTTLATSAFDAYGLAGGSRHTCALRSVGPALCWGANDRGQLANGATSAVATPPGEGGPGSVVGLAGGETHSCFVTSVSSVLCFGDDTSGQVGGGTSSPSPVLTAAAPLFALGAPPDLVRGSVGAAARHTCAVSRDGRVYCWGSNSDGQLGDPTLASGSGAVGAPREVTGLR